LPAGKISEQGVEVAVGLGCKGEPGALAQFVGAETSLDVMLGELGDRLLPVLVRGP
jgi:hypothetical protein